MNTHELYDILTYPDFAGTDVPASKPEKAKFHIIPVPFEKTVSYGSGTEKGPGAILEASLQLEVFDGVDIPAAQGIYTHPPVNCRGGITKVLERISKTVASVLEIGKIPVMLGGEHTITYAAVKAAKEACGDIGVVQFDAHADLRDVYEENPMSHACVMRRVLDLGVPIHQIGVRSMSMDEFLLRKEKRITYVDAEDIASKNLPKNFLSKKFPSKIYISIDVDAFDPSLIPSTGTPEPGGLFWYDMIHLLSSILPGRDVVGFDVVELAPIAGMHASDFTIAKLVYALFGLIGRQVGK